MYVITGIARTILSQLQDMQNDLDKEVLWWIELHLESALVEHISIHRAPLAGMLLVMARSLQLHVVHLIVISQ